ncbi:Tau-tubulin kinase 2 [Kappamyces sp. JEL0680]|nr:Tau-tubulin kinase 2 [Kappamyces sp. JEL0680]
MVRAIEAVHSTGVLHRDIKPGNFCVARDTADGAARPLCHLIDFGLSRRFLNPGGSVREERNNVGFRGTARYASISAHCGKELGRVDDLWSLFYMLVEFLDGTLPWKGKEKEKIGDLKIRYTRDKLVAHLPPQMLHFLHYLQGLEYSSCPDYNYIWHLMNDMFELSDAGANVPYDWDMPSESTEAAAHQPQLADVEMDPVDQNPVLLAQAALAAEPDRTDKYQIWSKDETLKIETKGLPVQAQEPTPTNLSGGFASFIPDKVSSLFKIKEPR